MTQCVANVNIKMPVTFTQPCAWNSWRSLILMDWCKKDVTRNLHIEKATAYNMYIESEELLFWMNLMEKGGGGGGVIMSQEKTVNTSHHNRIIT